MPEQLFIFERDGFPVKLLIGARDPQEAWGMLRNYLQTHELVPQDEWQQTTICGKVAYGIFTLPA
jgi:hypothetical protein